MSIVTEGRVAQAAAETDFAVADCGIAAGTPVLTLAGAVAVEDLTPGTRIITRDGARQLTGLRRVAPSRMVRVSASAIGVEQPEEDMVIGAATPILIRDWRAKALKGCDQAIIRADRLIDGEYIRHETATSPTLYALEFDALAVIYAGGLELALAPARQPA
jgi:hypothetical protein